MKINSIAYTIGTVFILLGCLVFIPNPLIGNSGTEFFYAEAAHNAIYVFSGILFWLVAMIVPIFPSTLFKTVGIFYFLLGIFGLFSAGTAGMGTAMGFLDVNGTVNFLHLAIGVLIFAVPRLIHH